MGSTLLVLAVLPLLAGALLVLIVVPASRLILGPASTAPGRLAAGTLVLFSAPFLVFWVVTPFLIAVSSQEAWIRLAVNVLLLAACGLTLTVRPVRRRLISAHSRFGGAALLSDPQRLDTAHHVLVALGFY